MGERKENGRNQHGTAEGPDRTGRSAGKAGRAHGPKRGHQKSAQGAVKSGTRMAESKPPNDLVFRKLQEISEKTIFVLTFSQWGRISFYSNIHQTLKNPASAGFFLQMKPSQPILNGRFTERPPLFSVRKAARKPRNRYPSWGRERRSAPRRGSAVRLTWGAGAGHRDTASDIPGENPAR